VNAAERKKPNGIRIAASGTPIRTSHVKRGSSAAYSTNIWQIKGKNHQHASMRMPGSEDAIEVADRGGVYV